MPCDSSYLAQNEREEELQRAAKLLAHVYETLGEAVPAIVKATAEDLYASNDLIPDLCAKMKSLSPALIELVAYDAHSKTSRNLAGWWETHLKADAAREAGEATAAEKVALKRSARAKLSAEEREALGI